MAKKDYPELIGKKLNYTTTDMHCYEGVVVDCNYDIGITIINANDKNMYLACLIGPSANIKDMIDDFEEKYYKTIFYAWVRWIKNGAFNVNKSNKIDRAYKKPIHSLKPSAETCPFNQ